MAKASAPPALLGDIGGTNSRFALLDNEGAITRPQVLLNRDHAGLAEAARAYLAQTGAAAPREAALCFACPVEGDRIHLTNHGWDFSLRQLRSALGIERLEAVNDFAAVALAVPRLAPGDVERISGGKALTEAPVGVLGAGTGLGVASLLRDGAGWRALPGEGGHVTMAAMDDEEAAVLARLRRRFDHVSAERVVSGPGLVNLYQALCDLAGRAPTASEPAEVALAQEAEAVAARRIFSAMLGTVAGDLALTLGARGGVYLAGGVALNLGAGFDRALFRRRFEAKGRLSDYLALIPTSLITHTTPAFLGLASLLARSS
ncbi:MAG: glucokinase [Alphaproteobacteria bacterium]|nr:glucokinase [Alphaproteobacteria bacterium]